MRRCLREDEVAARLREWDVRVGPALPAGEHRVPVSPDSPITDDPLAPARGVVNGLLMSAAAWVAILWVLP